MNLTHHAKTRSKQRAINYETVEIIQQYGRISYAPGGAEKYFYGAREHQNAVTELKQTLKRLERAKNGILIVVGDKIITSYKAS